ncbi:hypothetical protein BDB01DRAFT_782774 [Pilobolus umbonatus]|nr:hypothetical protein BDB01DRAFT_782768 [Pilobolus umbonatus]KAI8988687.1 hypothetical protein BDB01DRAFT_782774 [Pilobolus umbonatus]
MSVEYLSSQVCPRCQERTTDVTDASALEYLQYIFRPCHVTQIQTLYTEIIYYKRGLLLSSQVQKVLD